MRILSTGLAGLALSACTASVPPDVTGLRSPTAAETSLNVSYRPVIGDYTHRTSVEPRPWRGSNDAQAPEEGS